VPMSRRVSWFLVAFGAWSWIIWLTFLKNIWNDDRSWDDGMTTFFVVHLLLVMVSIVFGTVIAAIGVRSLRWGRTSRDGVAAVPPR
jgi:threonine/homoserine/homoserine lactone efflux protein